MESTITKCKILNQRESAMLNQCLSHVDKHQMNTNFILPFHVDIKVAHFSIGFLFKDDIKLNRRYINGVTIGALPKL